MSEIQETMRVVLFHLMDDDGTYDSSPKANVKGQ